MSLSTSSYPHILCLSTDHSPPPCKFKHPQALLEEDHSSISIHEGHEDSENHKHSSAPHPVSYTHLDVYKRQVVKDLASPITVETVSDLLYDHYLVMVQNQGDLFYSGINGNNGESPRQSLSFNKQGALLKHPVVGFHDKPGNRRRILVHRNVSECAGARSDIVKSMHRFLGRQLRVYNN